MSIIDAPAAIGGSILDPIQAKIKNPFNTGLDKAGERGPDFPGGFEITEFIAGVEQPPVKLQGNMMPMQPFPWEGEQRLIKEYYPGNPEAAVQVLGPKEGDLVIHGRFKDKQYKSDKLYGVSYQLARQFEEIRKRGNLLKFGMHGAAGGGDWFRYGYLEKTSFKMNKLSWIDYEFSFFIVSDTKPVNNYFAAPEKTSPSAINQALIDQAAAFQSTYSTMPVSMPQSIGGFLNGLISSVATNINLVTNFVGTAISTGADIAASATRALGLIKNARANLSVFSRQVDSIKHTFTGYSNQGNLAKQFSDTYKNLIHVSNAQSASTTLAASLAKMQAQFEKIAKTIPIARYRVISGDTLQKIATKFYGSPDNWSLIYSHNKLTSTNLVEGTVLEIPKA